MDPMSLMLKGYRLTTAEIVYHLPDFPELLQSYIWQEYDLPPSFPQLIAFLTFWKKSLDGKLHSVYLDYIGDVKATIIKTPGFVGLIH